MEEIKPITAVMTGYAYEQATASLGVLEQGKNTDKWISAEMLCTLDNFVRTVLFSERIYLTPSMSLDGERPVFHFAEFLGTQRAKKAFEAANCFENAPEFHGDTNAVRKTIADVLQQPEDANTPWITIECSYEPTPRIRQELVIYDPHFIEYAISQFGLQHFKAVFPGEHLYLGLRQSRGIKAGIHTHTVAEVACRRIRTLVREKMEALNEAVPLGAPPIPVLPPIFVSRLLYECRDGANVSETLFEVRKSPAMTRFREWMGKCTAQIISDDVALRTKASQAIKKLQNLSVGDISVLEFTKGVLKIAKASASFDVLGIIEEVLSPVASYIGGFPLAGLTDLGQKKGDVKALSNFLDTHFGDRFSPSERDYISALLKLPDNIHDWNSEKATFRVTPTRIDATAPMLSRPCFMTSSLGTDVHNAQKQFDELWNKAKPLREDPKQ